MIYFQLKTDILPLGEEQIKNVLDTAAEVIEERLEKKSKDHIKKLDEKNLYLLNTSKEKIDKLFQDKENHTYSQISTNLFSAVNTIEERKATAVKGIKEEARVQQERVEKTGDDQVKRIEDVLTVNQGLDDKTVKGTFHLKTEHLHCKLSLAVYIWAMDKKLLSY